MEALKHLANMRCDNKKTNKFRGKIGIFAILICLSAELHGCKEDPRLKFPDFEYQIPGTANRVKAIEIPEGTPIAIVRFSVDCLDCKNETDSLLKNMHLFKNVRFYFMTTDSVDRIDVFRKYFKIEKYPNIVIGQDYKSYLPVQYGTYATPLLALYDGRKRLRAIFEGTAKINKLYDAINKIN
jgi:thiol-disulfide isomerase/thioredoxin